MARHKSPARPRWQARLHEYAKAYDQLAAELGKPRYLWNGSVTEQRLTCGKPSCACHRDPARRHGPYLYWSTKIAGRTVSRLLKPDEAELYREWIDNRREIERIQRAMVKLSKKLAPLVLRERRR
jgi:hypothetical protein